MSAPDRFLTTHVGSLPRPEALLDLVFAREGGEPVSEADFDAAVEQRPPMSSSARSRRE